MAWTPPTDPENEPRDRIKLAVGDDNADEELLPDEWYDAKLSEPNASEKEIAYLAAMAIAGHFSREVATALGPLKEEAHKKWEHYLGLAGALYNIWQGLAPGTSGGGGIFNMGNALVGWRAAKPTYPVPFFTRTKP